jgi:hypothetical protein
MSCEFQSDTDDLILIRDLDLVERAKIVHSSTSNKTIMNLFVSTGDYPR